MKKLVTFLSLLIVLTGCGPLPLDVNRKTPYITYPDGGIVKTCSGSNMVKESAKTRAFWDNNNLPHGTINFVCRDGKAYLPDRTTN